MKLMWYRNWTKETLNTGVEMSETILQLVNENNLLNVLVIQNNIFKSSFGIKTRKIGQNKPVLAVFNFCD